MSPSRDPTVLALPPHPRWVAQLTRAAAVSQAGVHGAKRRSIHSESHTKRAEKREAMLGLQLQTLPSYQSEPLSSGCNP